MAKKKWGRILACTAIVGTAIAGGIAYFCKYKELHKSLDEDFDDFEDEFDDEDLDTSEKAEEQPAAREYVPINLDKSEETQEKETAEAAAKPSEKRAGQPQKEAADSKQS